MTHLILHKVRGEAAFDVAEQIPIGDEVGWIIPTSGHRAYPYMQWPLTDLEGDVGQGYFSALEVPADWPDHYECNDTGLQTKVNVMAVISKLLPRIKRRL